MTSLETQKPRRSMLAKLAAGSLLAIGLLAAGVAPANADDDDWHGKKHWKHGNGHGKQWKHNQGHWDGYGQGYYHQKPRRPKVVYYAPPPVYYAPPPPVYYQPAPVYYQPAPVYHYPRKPSVSIVFPITID